jgi:hypothetical protein
MMEFINEAYVEGILDDVVADSKRLLVTTSMRHTDETSIEGKGPKWTRPRDDTSQGNDSLGFVGPREIEWLR